MADDQANGKLLPIVPFLKIPDDGDPYLEGFGGMPTNTSLRKYRGKEVTFEFSSEVQAVVDHFGPTDFLKMGGNHSGPTSAESIRKPVEARKACSLVHSPSRPAQTNWLSEQPHPQ